MTPSTDANENHPNGSLPDLAERMLRHILAAEPLEGTLLGFREYDAKLADLSRAHDALLAQERAAIRTAAEAIDAASLSEQERVTRAVIIALADYGDDVQAVDAIEFTVASFAVTPSSVLLAYLPMLVVTDAEQADAYLQRLSEVPRYLQQAEERLEHGRQTGLLPVARLVQNSADQIEALLGADPCPLVLEPHGDWDGADDWRGSVSDLVERVVKPAFAAHRDALLQQALPTARSDEQPGLVHIPEGLERYERLIRVHTTTSLTAQQLHQTGLDMVKRIHAEFSELGDAVFGIREPRAIFERLLNDPDLRWSSEQAILDAAETAVRRAETAAPGWFGRLPEAVCAIAPIPELEADGSAAAYYMPPAVDGSHPGTYYANVVHPEERTSYDLESVAFHEAVPGHHFQLSLALEQQGLPMLRRLTLFTAYAEGWGLYSERLADEMGLYSSDLQRMGMLSADAWRASRLVVDTGMHALGWSRQEALDFMLENTAVAPIEAAAEVDRYIAYPGQALSYMTGRLEIQSLRARAEEALGAGFDIKGFHDRVLGIGAVPLSVLGKAVDEWIASRAPQDAP
jgi:uncharacterized protein (DUF885 family)